MILEKKTKQNNKSMCCVEPVVSDKKLLPIDYCWVRNAEVDEEKTNKLNSMLPSPKKKKKKKKKAISTKSNSAACFRDSQHKQTKTYKQSQIYTNKK